MRIRWTIGANRNLEQIEHYIAQENPQAAIDTVLTVIKTVELLTDQPAIGRIGRIHGTRELVNTDTPYIVPYRVKNHTIEILRVIHSARQWPSKL